MKKLDVNWNGINDSTGYLFSFAKSLCAAVKNSPYPELAENIVASSGFAFRMWVAYDLCPSGTSIWSFDSQKPWIENGGLLCDYIGRYWEQNDVEQERRCQAIENIKKSINNGTPAISWDIGIPEWGLITGYNDEMQILSTLSITGEAGEMAYETLGKREIPILSVLTVTGKSHKSPNDILTDTLKLVKNHLTGGEWCENAKGLEAYPVLISHLEEKFDPAALRNLGYYLGTYGALKWYAYKYLEKNGLNDLAILYRKVYENWIEAFKIKSSQNMNMEENRSKIANLLKEAHECEVKAVELM